MKLIKLICGNCGAPIDRAKGGSRLMDCPFCHVQLRIHRCEGAIYTSIAQAINRSADQIASSTSDLNTSSTNVESHLSVLRSENAVMELDHQWQQSVDALSKRTLSGARVVPNPAGAVALAILGLFFLPFLMVVLEDWKRLLVVPWIPAALWLAWHKWQQLRRYESARASYVRRRHELMAELARARQQFGVDDPAAARTLVGDGGNLKDFAVDVPAGDWRTKLIPVICQRCAAPLRVPEKVKFVTCGHCDTRLQIESEGDHASSRVLDDFKRYAKRVQQHADQVTAAAGQLQRESMRLRLRNDLLRIEGDQRHLQDWFARQRAQIATAKSRSPPTIWAAVFDGVWHLAIALLPWSLCLYGAMVSQRWRGFLLSVSVVLTLVILVIVLRLLSRIRAAKRYQLLVSQYQYHQRVLNQRMVEAKSQLNALQ